MCLLYSLLQLLVQSIVKSSCYIKKRRQRQWKKEKRRCCTATAVRQDKKVMELPGSLHLQGAAGYLVGLPGEQQGTQCPHGKSVADAL